MNTSQFFLVLLFVLPASIVYGQKGETGDASESYGIFQSQDEYHQFMGSVKREGLNNPELMAMVPMINDVVLGQPIGSTGQKYDVAGSTLGLLADREVRKDLEMVDAQYQELQKSNAEIQKRAAQQLRSLDFSDLKNVSQRILEIRDQSETELQETLLPHQMDRLRQILAQSQLRRRSLVDIITSEPMKTRLDITDQQSRKLKTAEKEIQEDLEKQIAELRQQARKRLISKLNRDQREQVEQIFGDTFEFRQPEKKTGKSKKPTKK